MESKRKYEAISENNMPLKKRIISDKLTFPIQTYKEDINLEEFTSNQIEEEVTERPYVKSQNIQGTLEQNFENFQIITELTKNMENLNINLFGNQELENSISIDIGSHEFRWTLVKNGKLTSTQILSNLVYYVFTDSLIKTKALKKHHASKPICNTIYDLFYFTSKTQHGDSKTKIIDENGIKTTVDTIVLLKEKIRPIIEIIASNIQLQTVLFNIPSNLNENQIIMFKTTISQLLTEEFKGKYTPNIVFQKDIECMIYNHILEKDQSNTLFPGYYIIINQGFSSTQIGIAKVEWNEIKVDSSLLKIGGYCYTLALRKLIKTMANDLIDNGKHPIASEFDNMFGIEDLKIDLLNSEYDETMVYSISNIKVEIRTRSYDQYCLMLFREVDEYITSKISKIPCDSIKTIVISGGGMKNKKQEEYILMNSLKNIKKEVIVYDDSQIVSKGMISKYHYDKIFMK